jgi:HEAT repeat protein
MTRFSLGIVLIVCLSGCRPAAPPLSGGKPVSHWLEALKDPNPQQRKTAVFKLGNIGPTNPAVGPALLEALKDGDAAVRREAILAWMKFGPGAREAVGALTELQHRDPDGQVRTCAGQALHKLSGGPEPPR